jgi:hypothetical protein
MNVIIFSWIDIVIRFKDPKLLLSNSLEMNTSTTYKGWVLMLDHERYAYVQ